MIKKMSRGLILSFILVAAILTGCQNAENGAGTQVEKYETTFYDTFDTFVQVTYYTEDEKLAEEMKDVIHDRFMELHKLYDKYHEYAGVNNIFTINQLAGKEPVVVEPDLVNLIVKSKTWSNEYTPLTDITIGPVAKIWHDYRAEYEQGLDVTEPGEEVHTATETKLPEMGELEEAAKLMGMDKVVVDEEASTIYLKEEGMALDVGAIAKGYAAELVAQELKDAGIQSGIVNAGGNTRVIGSPVDGRESFLIGLQNPMVFDDPNQDNLLATIKVNDRSVVTSGDYQRYYIVDGKRYHHIIHPETLMPADYFRSVTIITEDSGLCDFLSTAVYCMPYDEGRAFVDGLNGIEAIWVHPDGSVDYTEGLTDQIEIKE